MNKEKRFIVYIHRLKTDGRVYVGQTNSSIKERAGSDGHRYKNCTKFWNAIQFYGWDAFDHIVVKDNLTLEEANVLEDELILQYNSIENGFNINRGGRNHIWTEEQRKIMSERNTGEKNPNWGKPRSEETKRKIGAANAISQLGHHHTEETKAKMRQAHIKDIPIRCLETGAEYSCPSEAALAIGKTSRSGGHITEVCQGKRKTAYGFHWEYINKESMEEE